MECRDCEVQYAAIQSAYCPVCGSSLMRIVSGVSSSNRPSVANTFLAGAIGREVDTTLGIRPLDSVNGNVFGFADQAETTYNTSEPAIQLSLEQAVLEDDLFSGLFQSFAGIVNNRSAVPLSKSYLKTLGKVILDDKLTLLNDVCLYFGNNLRFNVVPSTFSWIPIGRTLSGPIVWADPIYGESDLVVSTSSSDSDSNVEWKGKIVLFLRGKVSFAVKYFHAVQAGAVAVIICQSADMWPFVMADTAKELEVLFGSTTIPDVPCLMLSKQNTEDMHKLFDEANAIRSKQGKMVGASLSSSSSSSSSSTSMTTSSSSVMSDERKVSSIAGSLQFHELITECVICADAFCSGQEVVKLLCRHTFHCACVFTWLEKQSTCPVCRAAMPKETLKDPFQIARQGGDSNRSDGRQDYFV